MSTTVYFDLDGTLLEYTVEFDELRDQTLPVPVSDAIHATYTDEILAALAQMNSDPYERAFTAVCREYEIEADPKALAAEYVDREIEATAVADYSIRLVETIASKHRTGILTNGDGDVQHRKIAHHDLDELVDTVIVSNEVGSRKPDVAIFELAKERLPADEYIYVGDTIEEDVLPATECGFRTILVGDVSDKADVNVPDVDSLASVLLPLLE